MPGENTWREPAATPEFVRWSLDWRCPPRDTAADNADPESVERLLRAPRAASEARAAGRVHAGVAWRRAADGALGPWLAADDPEAILGFRLDEALRLFGGEHGLENACGGCPANAANAASGAWAGCHGLLEFTWLGLDYAARVDAIVAQAGLAPRVDGVFPPARRAWRRLWQVESPGREQLAALDEVCAALEAAARAAPRGAASSPATPAGLLSFWTATRVALTGAAPLRLRHYPPGEIAGGRWRLPEHCGRCKEVWRPRQTRCAECGAGDARVSPRARRLLGDRPFTKLAKLFSPEQEAAWRERLASEG